MNKHDDELTLYEPYTGGMGGCLSSLLMIVGVVGSLICYSAFYLERIQHATGTMAALSAMIYAGILLGSQLSPIRINRDTKTVTFGRGIFSQTKHVSSFENVILSFEQHELENGAVHFSYPMFINENDAIKISALNHLFQARRVAKEVSDFLGVPVIDRTQELTERLLPRDVQTKFGGRFRESPLNTPRRFQLSLLSTLILMLLASVVLGVCVWLDRLDSDWTPLAGPLGFFFLTIACIVLAESNHPPSSGDLH